MKCPICEKGKAALTIEKKKRIFRKEEFSLFEYFYKCSNCKEQFTTTEIDTINTSQVYNQYREKYSIPFPQQLTAIREKYNLSSAKMSEILGLGANQYRLYENGEIPTPSSGMLLSIITNAKEFRNIILKRKNTVKNSNKIVSHLDAIISSEESFTYDLKRIFFCPSETPNRFTGFTVPDFEKFANMVLFFVEAAPFKVRLNKLLYYADFTCYKYYGFSISGCRYAAIDMGAVPEQYSFIYSLLESEKYLTTEKVKNKEYDKFVALQTFNSNLFNESELIILDSVLKKFSSKTTDEIKLISHNEKGWIDNISKKSLIDYSIYAPQLIAF